MKGAYPVLIKEYGSDYLVYVPDMEIYTEGKSVADAMEMARDAIGLKGMDYLEDDVDFEEYKKRMQNRAVKKNCTIPYWMSVEADKAGINYSRVLQEALMNLIGKSAKGI